MVANFFNWQADSFFASAETVQDSADSLQSNFRSWLRVLDEGASGGGGAEPDVYGESEEAQRLKLETFCDTVTWQLEEFGKAVEEAGRTDGSSAWARRVEFVEVIKHQVAAVRRGLAARGLKTPTGAALPYGAGGASLASFLGCGLCDAGKGLTSPQTPALKRSAGSPGGAPDGRPDGSEACASAANHGATGYPSQGGPPSSAAGDAEGWQDGLAALPGRGSPLSTSSDGSWKGHSLSTSSSSSSLAWDELSARAGAAAGAAAAARAGEGANGGPPAAGASGREKVEGRPRGCHPAADHPLPWRHGEASEREVDPASAQPVGWGRAQAGGTGRAAAGHVRPPAAVEIKSQAPARLWDLAGGRATRGGEADAVGVRSDGRCQLEAFEGPARGGAAAPPPAVLMPAAFHTYWGAMLKKRPRDAEQDPDVELGMPAHHCSSDDSDGEEASKELAACGGRRSPRPPRAPHAAHLPLATVTGFLRPCLCWGVQGCVVLALCAAYISLSSPAHWSSVT